MTKQSSPANDTGAVEDQASRAVERGVAKTIGRPLGALTGVLGFGLGLAAFGSGDFTAAVGWLTLGAFGFAMLAVGRSAADQSA